MCTMCDMHIYICGCTLICMYGLCMSTCMSVYDVAIHVSRYVYNVWYAHIYMWMYVDMHIWTLYVYMHVPYHTWYFFVGVCLCVCVCLCMYVCIYICACVSVCQDIVPRCMLSAHVSPSMQCVCTLRTGRHSSMRMLYWKDIPRGFGSIVIILVGIAWELSGSVCMHAVL
jgi:hypothetical protein